MNVLPLLLVILVAVLAYGYGDRDSANLSSPNIILVCIDALRADHLGCYGYSRETSPVLASLRSLGYVN